MTTWLIGLDDTDNLHSRGTGYRARVLVTALGETGIADACGVTRHQLLVDDRIPYTSHNSCAVLEVTPFVAPDELFDFCRGFMLEAAADGSDVGLALAERDRAGAVADYGRSAKREVLDQDRARAAASAAGIRLEGLTGTHDGIIGSLAGIGLFDDGNDGRYLWRPALRDMSGRVVRIADILARTGIDAIKTSDGDDLSARSELRVALGEWPRPVRVDGRAVLLVQPCQQSIGQRARYVIEEDTADEPADVEVVPRDWIKAYRP